MTELALTHTPLPAHRPPRLALVSLLHAGVAATLRPAPAMVRRRQLRQFARRVCITAGVQVRIRDERPFAGTQRGLVIADFHEAIDLAAIATVMPARFVIDPQRLPEFAREPLLRHGVVLDPTAPDAAQRVRDALNADEAVCVFRDSARPLDIGPALETGAPLLPLVLRHDGTVVEITVKEFVLPGVDLSVSASR